MFLPFILTRILFIASMVFILGYVFGNFSKSKTLASIAKVASVMVIILFIATNALLFRAGGWQRHSHNARYECQQQKDSVYFKL